MKALLICMLLMCLFGLNTANKRRANEVPSKQSFTAEIPARPSTSFQTSQQRRKFMVAASEGEKAIAQRIQEDQKLMTSNVVANPNSATGVHQMLLNGSSEANKLSLDAVGIEAAYKAYSKSSTSDVKFANSGKLSTATPRKFQSILQVSFINTVFGRRHCYRRIYCWRSSKYRTFDGSCNNRLVPLLGKASTPFLRLLPPAYQDYISKPRILSKNRRLLPCARHVSQVLGTCTASKNTANTMMVMQWGQFIDHDLTLSPTAKLVSGYHGFPIDCCNSRRRHSECFPICISYNDPFYGCFRKRCMNFVRTMSAPPLSCTFGPRQQVNDLSHFLDGSMIYGSSLATSNSLREFSGGRLLVNGDKLPPTTSRGFCKPSAGYCFRAGDRRVNEQPNLAITHLMWVREHNRIANYFNAKGLSDQDAFNKARKLVIAEIQYITYNEFLPVVLGSGAIGTLYLGYNHKIDPRISNAFATAAFRFGHSLLGDHLEQHWQHFPLPTQLPLSSLFSYQGLNHYWVNRMLFAFGLIRQHPEKVDMCFTKEVTQRLFEEAGKSGSGLDLVALNIQRGRDHGLPPYVEYRNNFCRSARKIRSFHDMTWLSSRVKSLLMSVYAHVEDVDLFVGGLLEPLQPGALVGETFQCIIKDQFYRLQKGDRYYYENKLQPYPFSSSQINAIKKVTLARIFCDNGDGITKVQKNVFSSSGSLQSCRNTGAIPKLNLALFP